MGNAFLHALEGFVTCHAQCRRAGAVFCTGALSSLLSAAEHQRFHLQALAHIEHPNALRSMNLMTAHRQQVNFHFFHINGVFPEGLHRIHMIQTLRILLLNQLADCRRILHRSRFVIYQNRADQNRIGADGICQLLQGDMSLSVHLQPCDLCALFL